jgi:SAM-dependent methyltransferase
LKRFERTYLLLEPFYLPLHRMVRARLLKICQGYPRRPELLDVGGRKSHYTIGVPATVTITDLPRESAVQKQLNLGINEEMMQRGYARRSNVKTILFDDMTQTALPENSYDIVVAVEVLEHVDEDAKFVEAVYRVLRPGGLFLMTTPNGDFVENHNPDHKRHYHRNQLRELLAQQFPQPEVQYAIRGGITRKLGLKSWSLRRPWQIPLSMAGNFVNWYLSQRPGIHNQAHGTHHLLAQARKPV